MGASGGGRRRLLVFWMLSCVVLSAAAEHRPDTEVRRQAADPSPPQRGRRGIQWHKMLEPGRNDGVAYAVDVDDDDEEGQDVYPTAAPQILHAYQEDWLLDNILSQVQRQDATWGTDEHNQPAELPSYRKWVPKISLGRAKGQGRTPEQQEDVASPKHEDYSPTNGVTPSSSTTPTVDRTEKARSTTLAKGADDDIGQCPAQQVIPKPQLTTDTKSRGLMEALFGTKLTTLVTATVKATKNTGTTTKDYSTAKATTKEATRTKSHPTTVRTTQQASNRTASERPKIASAIQVAPKNDIGKFVINRFARVSRESAYMEHMEPMVAFACRVHLWIIGVLCALVLLLAVALFTKKERQVEPVVPTRPPEPPYTPPMPVSPASPLIKRPPTEVWEDDLYDVSEIAKLEKRHSTI